MFERLINKVEKVTSLNPLDILHELFLDQEFRDLIIRLNTRSQLYDKGINYKGVRLDDVDKYPSPSRDYSQGKVYAISTEEGRPGYWLGKFEKHLPYNRITLFDEGDFYKTFEVLWQDSHIRVTADTVKDGMDLMNRFGIEIVGLSEESISELRDYTRSKLKQIVLQKIKMAA